MKLVGAREPVCSDIALFWIGRVSEPPLAMQTRPLIASLLAGFLAGAGGAAAYLLLGGSYFITIPHWAEITFAPGFLAGNWIYQATHAEAFAKVVGVLAVGFAYAPMALIARWLWMCAVRFGLGSCSNPASARELHLSRSKPKQRLDS